MDRKALYRIPEAQEYLGISRKKLYELIGQELETVHIGRAVRIPLASLEAYVEGLREAAAPGAR